jgi:lipoyl(octanoyl) transferase
MSDGIRVVFDDAGDGFWNMAVDEAILQSVIEGRSPPTLRFYGWKPACLSLGYFQRSDVVNRMKCREHSVDIVRRITGGRAVFHDQEFTYSFAMPVPQGNKGSILETFKVINGGIVKGLQGLGVRAVLHRREGRSVSAKSPLCFSSPSHYEITVEGKKILGSAQVRRGGALLQQGSLPLRARKDMAEELLKGDPDSLDEDGGYAGLEEFLPTTFEREHLVYLIVQGFREIFSAGIDEALLTPDEIGGARSFYKDKYAQDSWNFRR